MENCADAALYQPKVLPQPSMVSLSLSGMPTLRQVEEPQTLTGNNRQSPNKEDAAASVRQQPARRVKATSNDDGSGSLEGTGTFGDLRALAARAKELGLDRRAEMLDELEDLNDDEIDHLAVHDELNHQVPTGGSWEPPSGVLQALLISEQGVTSPTHNRVGSPLPRGFLGAQSPTPANGTLTADGRDFPMTTPTKSYIPRIDPPPQVFSDGSFDERMVWSSSPHRSNKFQSDDENGHGFRRVVSTLDSRAWLEVADVRHRYAKNLRTYYEAWDLLGKPEPTGHLCTSNASDGSLDSFWRWLDEPPKDGRKPFDLETCPRAKLEADTVHYCTSTEAAAYAINVRGGRFYSRRSRGLDSGDGTEVAAEDAPLSTGDEGWIFVLRNGTIFAAAKRTTPPRFHHSSFFAGACVEAAGVIVTDSMGKLRRLYPHSGHYRPGDEHITHILRFLRDVAGVDYLGSVEVDGQHTMKVARLLRREGNGRVKKKDRPHFLRGDALLSFLELKAFGCSSGLFDELQSRIAESKQQELRRATVTGVHNRSHQVQVERGEEQWQMQRRTADSSSSAHLSGWRRGADDNTDFEFEGDEPIPPPRSTLYFGADLDTAGDPGSLSTQGVSTQGAERRKTSSDFDDLSEESELFCGGSRSSSKDELAFHLEDMCEDACLSVGDVVVEPHQRKTKSGSDPCILPEHQFEGGSSGSMRNDYLCGGGVMFTSPPMSNSPADVVSGFLGGESDDSNHSDGKPDQPEGNSGGQAASSGEEGEGVEGGGD